MALVTGFGILYSLLRQARQPHVAAADSAFDPTAVSLSGVQPAQSAGARQGSRTYRDNALLPLEKNGPWHSAALDRLGRRDMPNSQRWPPRCWRHRMGEARH